MAKNATRLSIQPNSFFSTKLNLIRNRKHCKVVAYCKTHFTLDRFTTAN